MRCRKVTFVHRLGIFCGCRKKMQLPVHKMAFQRGRKVPEGDFCPQNWYLLWMPKEKCNRLSTKWPSSVDARCQEVSFVHRMGVFCGRPQAARWLFPFYSQLLYLVPLFLGHYEEGDSEFLTAGAKAAYCVGQWGLAAFVYY